MCILSYLGLFFKLSSTRIIVIMDKRNKQITRTSVLSIVANILLVGFKAVVGLLSHSIAITLDAVNNFSDGTGGLGTVILSALILLDIVFMYYYTSKKNPIGPVLEYIFGVLLIIDGILFCLLIIFIIIGIIYIALGLGVLKEAKWFKNYIDNLPETDNSIQQ